MLILSAILSIRVLWPPGRVELTKQEFYELCTPHLYRTIVTQDLPLLLDHLERPFEISGVTTKSQSLHTCQRLFIEYKQYGRESGYAELLRHNDWGSVGMTVKQRERRAEDEARRDVDGIGWEGWRHSPLLNAILKLSRKTLGSLRTLSMCALANPDPIDWKKTFQGQGPHSPMFGIPIDVTEVVKNLGIDHFCGHMTEYPHPLMLNTGDFSPPSASRSATSVFIHIRPGASHVPWLPWARVTCIHHDQMVHPQKCEGGPIAGFAAQAADVMHRLQVMLTIALGSMAGDPQSNGATPSLSLKLYASPRVGQNLEEYFDKLKFSHLPPRDRVTFRDILSLTSEKRTNSLRRLAEHKVESERRVIGATLERWKKELSPEVLSELDVEWGTINEAPRCPACGFKENSFLDDNWDDYIEQHGLHDLH